MKIMSKYIASLLLALLISTPFLSGCLEMNDEWQSEPLSSRTDPDSMANPTGEEQMAMGEQSLRPGYVPGSGGQ